MSAFLPLVLSAKCKKWREDDDMAQEADVDFRKVRKSALERDKDTCRFCGFLCRPSVETPAANFYMQVHHRDDDHHNNDLRNLVTACMHCHACQHIGLYGSMFGASLVWLPEMTQAQLHHVHRAIMVARHFAGSPGTVQPDVKKAAVEVADACEAVYGKIKLRMVEAEERYLTSNPADLATALMRTPPDAYQRRGQTFSGLRLLLPHSHDIGGKDVMPTVVGAWLAKGGPFFGIKPPVWTTFLKALPDVA